MYYFDEVIYMSVFGENLRKARKSKKLTQKELATMANVSMETISKVELGSKFPSLSTAISFAMALDIDFLDLVDRKDTDWTKSKWKHEDYISVFTDNVVAFMQQHKNNQVAFAEANGMPYATFARVIKGQTDPGMKTLETIASMTNSSLRILMTRR